MVKFWAHMHVGYTIEFLGFNWLEGGFTVDAEGRPIRDPRGNTVASFSADMIDPAEDFGMVRDAYAGEGERVGDRDAFADWLAAQGFDATEAAAILRATAEELTVPCLYCGEDVRYRDDPGNPGNPSHSAECVPAAEDDAAWQERAAEHDPDCEWILTRAHRLEPEAV